MPIPTPLSFPLFFLPHLPPSLSSSLSASFIPRLHLPLSLPIPPPTPSRISADPSPLDSCLQPAPQSYGLPALFFQDDSAQTQFSYVPDDGSGVYVVDVNWWQPNAIRGDPQNPRSPHSRYVRGMGWGGVDGDCVGVLLAFGQARGSWDINSEHRCKRGTYTERFRRLLLAHCNTKSRDVTWAREVRKHFRQELKTFSATARALENWSALMRVLRARCETHTQQQPTNTQQQHSNSRGGYGDYTCTQQQDASAKGEHRRLPLQLQAYQHFNTTLDRVLIQID
ncbi:hypothetical protein FA13DRAFT_1718700 [Coprinellus micaceus]|uniref:Uncharacterized protein n=1 Tax=Coprinellus micaceus TaxID=71717 RepID=A0A4Y7SDR6_COPMI|nr:hypothetical protein FA13DRAFT_1718700 [Coprinellus micaceus]